jgi:hypothetical protein
MALRFPEYLVSQDDLFDEFPTPASARAQLANDHLMAQEQGHSPKVTYTHWQTRGLPAGVALLATGAVMFVVLLTTVLGGPPDDRTWLQFFAVWVCRLGLMVLGAAFVAAIWWGRRRTVLLFTPQAFAWECAGRRRVATWRTLGDVGVQRRGWPPVMILMHGGAGAVFAPPTKTAARAIARLCIAYREQGLANPKLGHREQDLGDRDGVP